MFRKPNSSKCPVSHNSSFYSIAGVFLEHMIHVSEGGSDTTLRNPSHSFGKSGIDPCAPIIKN